MKNKITELLLLNNFSETFDDGMTIISIIAGEEFLWSYHRYECDEIGTDLDAHDRSLANQIILKNYDETIELDDTCENHPALNAIETAQRMLFGDLLASGTKITETLLLDGYTGLFRDTAFFASTIEGKEIVWTYYGNNREDGSNPGTDIRKDATEICLGFDRLWAIGLDDNCENHPALAAIAIDFRTTSETPKIEDFPCYEEKIRKWEAIKPNL